MGFMSSLTTLSFHELGENYDMKPFPTNKNIFMSSNACFKYVLRILEKM